MNARSPPSAPADLGLSNAQVPRTRRRFGALLRSALAACATVVALSAPAGAAPLTSGPLTAAQQRQIPEQIDAVGRRGFLYEVARPGASGPAPDRLFLSGTIHLGRAGGEPFNTPLLSALRQSKRLALEADPTDVASTKALALQLGRYGDGDGLQRHVTPALLARVRAFGEKKEVPIDQMGRFKPWLLANMVALDGMGGAGLDPALGSELYLSGFARGLRMPIVEVEGLETRLRMLAACPTRCRPQLDEVLADVDGNAAQNDGKALFDLWLPGDGTACDALVATMHRDAATKVFERDFVTTLIDQRNARWPTRPRRISPGRGYVLRGRFVAPVRRGGPDPRVRAPRYRVHDLQAALGAHP